VRRVFAIVVITAAAAVSSVADAAPQTRSCGFYSFGIGWHLRASPNLSCKRARRVFKDCFVSNNGQTRSCSEGFRCRIRANTVSGISTETCVRGRKEVIGKGGP
jgi:hypothetical protein